MSSESGLSRREAIALLLAALATPLTPRSGFAASPRRAPGVSQQTAFAQPSIARAAVIHDALTLLASDEDVTGEWQDVLVPLPVAKPWEYSYAYGVANIQDDGQLVVDVVAEARADWDDRQPAYMDLQRYKGSMLERKLMVALGWAADRGGATVLFEGFPVEDMALRVDGVFLHALSGADTLQEREAYRIFRLLYERTLVAMHTIEPDLDGWGGLGIAAMHELKDPDPGDVNRFIDAYADWIESIDRRCHDLARAAASSPPPGLPAADRFYDRSDPILAAAEGLRRGVGTANAPNTWSRDVGRSRYALAVSAAYANARLVFEAARGDRAARDVERLLRT